VDAFLDIIDKVTYLMFDLLSVPSFSCLIYATWKNKENAAYLSSIFASERLIFCAFILTLEVMYVAFRSCEYIALIYIAGFYCKNIVIQSLALLTGTRFASF